MKKELDQALAQFYGSSVKKINRPEASDLRRVIDEFKESSPDIPIERLYSAYRSLKEIIDSYGPEFSSQSSYFNDVFLRILEERGESSNGIYRSVLRDSPEFRMLNSILGVDRPSRPEPEPSPDEEPQVEDTVEEPVKLTLKQVLAEKDIPLNSYSEEEWITLVDEYFIDMKDEKTFIRNFKKLITALFKRDDYEDYHLIGMAGYAMGRLNSYKKVDTKTKEYAMEILDLVSGRRDVWKRLHEVYTQIIKK